MFHKTRLILTAWYLLIIMTISLSFSAVIYIDATKEFDRILRMQRYRIEHPEREFRILQTNPLQFQEFTLPTPPDPQLIAEAKLRMFFILFGVNGIVFALSAIAGYFLAGRTLKPIKIMMEEQNRFIADASHELNTPLTALRTAIEVNLRNKDLNLSDAKQTLQSNLEEVEHLQKLSAELMTLAKHQEQYSNLSFVKLSTEKLLHKALEKVAPLIKEKNIVVEKHITNSFIMGNERTIIALFVILLDNAVKYSSAETTITVKAQSKDKQTSITITDQGKGIAKEDVSHIFDRFYRSDKSRTKQQTNGYGLGLSIAKRIITMHNATIAVASQLEKGSRFTVTFSSA